MEDLADVIERFDHVAFASHRILDLAPMLESLGGVYVSGGINIEAGFRWAQYVAPGDAKIEVLEPATPDCFLQRFLDERGPGIHHITYKVRDIHLACARAAHLGFELIGRSVTNPDWKEVFIHPKNPAGTVIQLAEWTDDPDAPPLRLSDVLALEVPDA